MLRTDCDQRLKVAGRDFLQTVFGPDRLFFQQRHVNSIGFERPLEHLSAVGQELRKDAQDGLQLAQDVNNSLEVHFCADAPHPCEPMPRRDEVMILRE